LGLTTSPIHKILTHHPSRRNRQLIDKNKKKARFFGLADFFKKKIAIFWSEKKERFFLNREKSGKNQKNVG
jgi:hypothetical protein